jgi:hypothetical protein
MQEYYSIILLASHMFSRGPLKIHSYALAVSALRTPLSCHPTLTPVSLNTSFPLVALALASTTRFLFTELARLVTYFN